MELKTAEEIAEENKKDALIPDRNSNSEDEDDDDDCRPSENIARPSDILKDDPDLETEEKDGRESETIERPSENLERPSETLERPSENLTKIPDNLDRPSQFKNAFRDSRFSDLNKGKAEPKISFMFKVALLGDICVGKTALVCRLVDNVFNKDYKATIGIEFKLKTLIIDDETEAELRIFDTMGSEKYRAITRQYYKDAEGIFLVYDITSEKSFKSIEPWLKEIENNAPKDCIVFLIGNKSDLTGERKVEHDEAQKFADSKNLYFVEVSAKKGINISLMFERMGKELVKNAQKKLSEANSNPRTSTKQVKLKETEKSFNKQSQAKKCC